MEILSLILWIIIIYFINKNKKKKKKNNYERIINEQKNNNMENEKIVYIDLSKYQTNGYIMTKTELIFYKELKKVTDKLELTIFPQINLERLINVYDNNYSDRNKIKSRSIDFAIAQNSNCKIICCIELDDYTHERIETKKTDKFKDELFKKVKIPLYRIKVTSNYNLEELENTIKQNIS